MNVLDLFAGIGGFSLGLERAGFKTVAFCEIEPFCRKVLKKHWPDIPIYEDVKTIDLEKLQGTEIITAGFPCQDISHAGECAGISQTRSGLWWQARRCIRMVRPRLAVLENVAALLNRGMGTVLGSLAKIGYDTEWHCIPASAVGARHIRDRVFIFATPGEMDNADGFDSRRFLRSAPTEKWRVQDDTKRPCFGWGDWAGEPGMARVADGIPNRSHRLKGLGNAIVPAIAELIGRAIYEPQK